MTDTRKTAHTRKPVYIIDGIYIGDSSNDTYGLRPSVFTTRAKAVEGMLGAAMGCIDGAGLDIKSETTSVVITKRGKPPVNFKTKALNLVPTCRVEVKKFVFDRDTRKSMSEIEVTDNENNQKWVFSLHECSPM